MSEEARARAEEILAVEPVDGWGYWEVMARRLARDVLAGLERERALKAIALGGKLCISQQHADLERERDLLRAKLEGLREAVKKAVLDFAAATLGSDFLEKVKDVAPTDAAELGYAICFMRFETALRSTLAAAQKEGGE